MTQSLKSYSGKELRELRKKKGLSRARLSLLSGISAGSIRDYETSRLTPNESRLKRLLQVLLSPGVKDPEPLIDMKGSEFEAGKVYQIQDMPLGFLRRKTEINPANGMHCCFCYEGKIGIHYLFRETRGGWVRTYTAAQLLGKVIREAGE